MHLTHLIKRDNKAHECTQIIPYVFIVITWAWISTRHIYETTSISIHIVHSFLANGANCTYFFRSLSDFDVDLKYNSNLQLPTTQTILADCPARTRTQHVASACAQMAHAHHQPAYEERVRASVVATASSATKEPGNLLYAMLTYAHIYL